MVSPHAMVLGLSPAHPRWVGWVVGRWVGVCEGAFDGAGVGSGHSASGVGGLAVGICVGCVLVDRLGRWVGESEGAGVGPGEGTVEHSI